MTRRTLTVAVDYAASGDVQLHALCCRLPPGVVGVTTTPASYTVIDTTLYLSLVDAPPRGEARLSLTFAHAAQVGGVAFLWASFAAPYAASGVSAKAVSPDQRGVSVSVPGEYGCAVLTEISN